MLDILIFCGVIFLVYRLGYAIQPKASSKRYYYEPYTGLLDRIWPNFPKEKTLWLDDLSTQLAAKHGDISTDMEDDIWEYYTDRESGYIDRDLVKKIGPATMHPWRALEPLRIRLGIDKYIIKKEEK